MKKYRVKYCTQQIYFTDVEATHREDAIEKADRISEEGDLQEERENTWELLSVEEIKFIKCDEEK